MTKFIGRKVQVGFGKESTRGTAVAPTIRASKVNVTFDQKVEKVVDESSIGVIADAQDEQVTKIRSEGDLEVIANVNFIGRLFYALLGSFTSTTDTTGAYKHVMNMLDSNQSNSLTLALADENQDYRFPLCVIDSLEVDCKVEDYIKIKSTFKAKDGATSNETPSYSADYPLLGKHVAVKLATNLAGLGAASAISCRSFNISIKKNLEEDYALGSAIPVDFANSKVEVEGSFEIVYNDVTYRDMVFNNTQKALRLEAKDTTTTIGLTSNPRLTIDLPKVRMTEFSKNMDNDKLVTQVITFKGFYSMSDAKQIVAELVNTTASY